MCIYKLKKNYLHAFEEQIWAVEIHHSHDEIDLSIEINARALEILTEGSVHQFQSLYCMYMCNIIYLIN